MNFHDEKINEESYKYENDWSVRIAFGALLGAFSGAITGSLSFYNIEKMAPHKNLLIGTDDNSFIMGILGFIYYGFFGLILGGLVGYLNKGLSISMIIGFIGGVLTGIILLADSRVFVLSLFVMGLTAIIVSILTDIYYGQTPKINLEETRTNRLTRRR